MELTRSFLKISKLKHINKVVQGSQGAGKTFSILLRWIILALRSDRVQYCSIVSATIPQLREGTVKDFKAICTMLNIEIKGRENPYLYKVNKWEFTFFSIDKPNKGLGARRDRLFINEANRISYDIARQLIGRTHVERIFDFNPSAKFWCHTNFVDIDNCDFVKLTYKDNHKLPQSEIDEIEITAPWGKLPDPNYWRVYGLGEIGYVEGQIFNYKIYETIPENTDMQISYGVDFGGADPMTVVKVHVDHYHKRLYWEELFYASNADIKDVSAAILADGTYNGEIVACDHNPKQFITNLRTEGISAIAANKKNGLEADIKLLKQYELFIHASSKNLRKEADAYAYQVRNSGGMKMILAYPDQRCEDHGIDAGKYGTTIVVRS